MERERRFLPTRLELYQKKSGAVRIRGTAAVFYDGSPDTEMILHSGDLTFRERIMPGALALEDDVIADFQHQSELGPNQILGRTSSGTLELRIDGEGLHYEIDPPDTSLGRDVMELIRRGDVRGSSIGFLPTDEDSAPVLRDGDEYIREIRSARVFSLGPVVEPAFKATTAEVRNKCLSALREARFADVEKALDRARQLGIDFA